MSDDYLRGLRDGYKQAASIVRTLDYSLRQQLGEDYSTSKGIAVVHQSLTDLANTAELERRPYPSLQD